MAKASREFLVFAKPTGPICNLDCRYCYYLEKQSLYPRGESFRMPDDLLEAFIVQYIEASPARVITFAWHGGEPTILGLDYFRKIVSLQRKHAPPDARIVNGIQTNGTLLDEEWCRFFAAEGFRVGLSLDGPRELHDRYRLTKGHKPTHSKVMHAYRLLKRYGVPCDLLCVVNDQNVRRPKEVYRFFKEIGARYLQFLPIVERAGDGGVSSETVPAEAFGSFLSAIFDEWIRHDIGQITIQIFDEAVRPFCGMEHSLCIFRETCGDIPIIEHNGDFFSCDHFVRPEYRLGNIRDTPLLEMQESPAQKAFGEAKRAGLPRYCRECEFLKMCHGGCPKDRFIRTPDGEEGLNYLCAGYKKFFGHARPYLEMMASLWRAGQPVERLKYLVRSAEVRAAPGAGRNDPCPCGSGLKYKKCCYMSPRNMRGS